MSIIDYLQEWDLNKKAEHFCKTYLLGKSKKNISAVEPTKYAKRFLNFMQHHVFVDHLKLRRQTMADALHQKQFKSQLYDEYEDQHEEG